MNSRHVIGEFDSIESAARALAAEVNARAPALANSADPVRALRIEARVPSVDPLAWLSYHDNLIRMYCSNREGGLQIAAMGCADMLRYKSGEVPVREALDYVFARLRNLPDQVRYYGGMRFNEQPTHQDHTWERFGIIRFVLPAVELIRDAKASVLAVNLVQSRDLTRDLHLLVAQLHRLKTPPPLPAAHLPLPVSRVNLPDRDGWESMVIRARELMQAGELGKLVLSRRCNVDFGEPLNPMALLQRLFECTPDSFHFCFNYGNEIAFIGASPERLYRRQGLSVVSEALAGTRPRGASAEDDQWLASELMASAKERKEHGIVADEIERILSRYCTSVQRGAKPEILKLAHVQHLHTVISGRLRDDCSDTDLLLALHPTPAIGGYPTPAALARIHELEPFDRGWFTAPIGWAMRDEAEFAVAIRCGLVEGSRLSLFSGAGIMPESDPEQEWREIESKIGNFLRILTS